MFEPPRPTLSGSAELTLERCPVCRATLTGTEPPELPCRRCNSDLRLLRLAYCQAQGLRQAARRLLARGATAEALRVARAAVALVNQPATRTTLAAALHAAGCSAAARTVLDRD